jgi:hypothetical protein
VSSALEGCWGIHLECHQFRRSFSISRNLLITVSHMVLSFEGDCLFTASSRAWTLAFTRRSCFSSHKSCCVNWFSKQSAITLAFSDEWNLRPEGPRIAVGALGPSLFRRGIAMGHIAWGVISELPNFVSHRSSHSSDWFRDPVNCNFTCWILVSCHNFLVLCLCFIIWSEPGRSLFMSESVILLVDNL